MWFKKLYHKFREPIDYLFWGVMTTLVSWLTFALFSLLLEKALPVNWAVTLANILSWVCAASFAFVTNKLWVFRSRCWARSVLFPEMGKFFSTRFLTGVLEVVGVPLLMRWGMDQTIFNVEGMLAKIVVSVVVVILNYIFSKLFIFRKGKKARPEKK